MSKRFHAVSKGLSSAFDGGDHPIGISGPRDDGSCAGFRTQRDVRLESGMRTKADMGETDTAATKQAKLNRVLNLFEIDHGWRRELAHLPRMSGPFIFKCPTTLENVQGWLDDDDDAPDDRYEAMACPACARLHFFNRKTGKMLGHDNE